MHYSHQTQDVVPRWSQSAPVATDENRHCCMARLCVIVDWGLYWICLDDDGWFLTDEEFWEGWWSVLACSLVAVEWFLIHTPLHLGQMKVWAEDDWDAACSFCLIFFAASGLSTSNWQVAFFTDERQLFRSEASRCHDWWLIPACARCLFSWSLSRFLGICPTT